MSGRRFALAIAVTTMVFVPWVEAAYAAKAKPQPSFFNTRELRSTDLKPFDKWTAALARYSKEKLQKNSGQCAQQGLNICSYAEWTGYLDKLKPLDKFRQLQYVNAQMNKAKYVTDAANWGRKDYWASPAEFMARFGDCEDYAIVKYLSLRYLGWKDKDLRVVAVKDLNLRVGHAVLVAFIRDPKTKKKRAFVLDNQIKKVVEATRIRHYQPVFSINKRFWWRHVT